MKAWKPVQKPAVAAEERLLEGITSGSFPVNSCLPAERELAEMIGVTRPTLREALQRLARDGWLDIQHGKPTRVRDYWMEGNLAVLSMMAQLPSQSSSDFVANLLEVRSLLAPAYTRQAIENSADQIGNLLAHYAELEDDPTIFSQADWDLQALLTRCASNPIYRLLLNSFKDLYHVMGIHYFSSRENRERSRAYYAGLLALVRKRALVKAEDLTRQVMEEALTSWKKSSLPVPSIANKEGA